MITPGFHGRRSKSERKRLPPGQHLANDFPVLSAGPTPRAPLADWTFTVEDDDGETFATWSWEELGALGATAWSRALGRVDLPMVTALVQRLGGMADCFGAGAMDLWKRRPFC
jgi:hypothetical protein